MDHYTDSKDGKLPLMYPDHNKRINWDPTINVGHLISAGSALIAALTFAVGVYIVLNTRVVVLEEARTYQQQRDLAQDAALRDAVKDVKDSVVEVKNNILDLRRDIRSGNTFGVRK